MRKSIEESTSIFKTSQGCLPQKQKAYTMNTARTHISPYGWVMIFMLLVLGVINFADKTVLGLVAVPIIKEIHLSPAQYGLVSGSFFLLYALSSVLVTAWSDRIGTKTAFALLGGIGLLWVIIWLLVGRVHPEASRMPEHTTKEKHPRSRWTDILPVLFSRTVLFSTLAAFASYWAIALYLSWNPVYLVTVRHLRLSDPLYLAGITLPYVVGGIALIACGAFADRVFRLTRSHRRSYAYPVTALLIVSALCVYLAVSVPSALGSVIFFTLALIGVTFPILATIITAVAPAAHRGAVLGTYVAISTLPGLIAPLVTGLIIQSAGRNIASGFYYAYLLASLLLLIGGIAFLAFVRPDDEQLVEKIPEAQRVCTRS